MQSTPLRKFTIKTFFASITFLLAIGCQTSSDVSPTLQAKLVNDQNLISLVSDISGMTNTYSDHLASLSASEKTKTISRIKELASSGQINEGMLTEISKLMGYRSMAVYKIVLNDIELSKRKLFEKFPELVDGSHQAEVQSAAEMSYNANALIAGSPQLQVVGPEDPGNCTGIYRACTLVVGVVAAGVVVGCGPAAPLCVTVAVLGATAGMELCYQEMVGCQSDHAVKQQ